MTRRHPLPSLVAALVVLVMALALAYAGRSTIPVPPTVTPPPGQSTVVVGLGGIAWDDVDPTATPTLWGLLRDGAAASVSVRTLHLTTCPTDGWATLSAGEAAGPAASTDRPECGPLPSVAAEGAAGAAGAGWRVVGFDALATASRDAAFQARLGLLGDSFSAAGTCVQAVGPGAALAAATSDGRVARYAEFSVTTLVEDLAQCPVSIVDVGALLATAPDPVRQVEQVNTVERRISQVVDAMPNGADLVVVGLSDRDREERLRVLAARGPHYAPGILGSASTRMAGVAQLSDVTATILQRGGVVPVTDIGGRALSVIPSDDNSEATAAGKLTLLTDFDARADAMHRIVAPFLIIWLVTFVLLVGVLWLVWRRAGQAHPTRDRVLRAVRLAATVSAAMPAATFLANLVPWWRASTSTPVLVAVLLLVVLAIGAALALVCLEGPWRTSALGPLAAMSAITVGVIGVDLVTGSRLQVSSVFGLQPLVGGRFYGMGNVAFALYAAATLLLCAVLAHALVRRQARRLAAVAVVVVGGAALAVDVLPAWGADFGGPIAFVPALGLLLLWVLGVHTSLRNLALVGFAAALVVAAVAYLDWRRPPDQRSHPGRFLQSMIDGGAWEIVGRKLYANVELAAAFPVLLLAVTGLILLAVVVVVRPGALRTAPFARLVDESPLLRRGLLAVVVMAVIGFLTNDSGAAIPPVAGILVVPVVLAAVVHHMAVERRPSALDGPGDHPV